MSGENCEDSTKLEPIAVYYSFGAGKENGAVTMRKEVGHADYREPLVRLSDVIAFLDTQRQQHMVGDYEVSLDIQEWEEMVDQLRDIMQGETSE